MTREEAIRRIKAWNLDSDDMEVLAVVIPELAESEDERIRKTLVEYISDTMCDEDHELYHISKGEALAYLEKQKECVSNNFDDVWNEEDCEDIIAEGQKLTPRFKELLKEVCHAWYDRGAKLEKQKEQKPNIEICPHSVKSKSYKENGFPFEGLKGPSSDPGDPGRRGRMGGVPKEISKEAEAFQAQFPGPYDKDDIITAYETAKVKAIEDLPQWKKAKIIGVGECTIGAAFEATGRRYPILYCYGYGISIEQLFEKLPKKED